MSSYNKQELELLLEDYETLIDSAREDDIFDVVETHHNCTVEVLKNTRTGEVSIGWHYEMPLEIGGNNYDNQRRVC